MTSHNDFNDDENDFENSADDSADRPAERSGEFSGAPGSSGADGDPSGAAADEPGSRDPNIDRGADGNGTVEGDHSVEGSGPVDEESPTDDDDRADVDLPQLLRQVSHVLGREFRAAAADGGFDPRDFGRGRRGRRGWDHDEAVVDGAPVPEEPVNWGPAWSRGGRGPIGDVSPEEFRRRMRELRDGIGSKVEGVLSSEEFEELKASLSKIVEAFGPDRCGDDPRDRSEREGRPSGTGRRDHHGGGRGRRGFGPGFGPGFGAGRRGFDPFGWGDDRRSREREVQEAFERGFAAGFEQGRNA